jgi:hypothetical protein
MVVVFAFASVKAKVAAWAIWKVSASYAVVFLSFPSPRRPSLYGHRLRLTHQTGHRQSAAVTSSCFEELGQS